MPALRLADHAVFDDTDGAGVILDTRSGIYLSLNATATLMVRAALSVDTLAETIDRLRQQIEASDAILEHGLRSLATQLDQRALLTPKQGDRS
ncbi:PqqD family protein [Nocardia colli]|uniref:PqqD family protein n=1 Tax=Nocardia colli TaxID=2545717 RepID=A0A5N0EE82_9NOCA|nr:PqqD family protein [Nocardia colli]KAA8887712.1 PqqD family protein [Nocardia colli]